MAGVKAPAVPQGFKFQGTCERRNNGMAKLIERLDPKKIKQHIKGAVPGYYPDGLGLYLRISQWGTASWLYRYKLGGREHWIGLGSAHNVSLSKARELRRAHAELKDTGTDPLEAKREKIFERRRETADKVIFKDAVEQYLAVHESQWKSEKHRDQWRRLTRDVSQLNDMPLKLIDNAQINEALKPLAKTPETANRVGQRVRVVVQWVKDGKPLPSNNGNGTEHQPAMQIHHLPGFMTELAARDGVVARALEFLILTATRTNSVTGTQWDEISGDQWTVPAARMKGGKRFTVPLSDRALAVLRNLPRQQGSPYVFHGTSGEHIGKESMAGLLKRMHKARAKAGLPAWVDKDSGRLAVPHGFRSTFSDWAHTRTNFKSMTIELALDHRDSNKVRKSYKRDQEPEERGKLMSAWANFCVGAGADVHQLHPKTA
jgi:integrase